MFSEEEITKIYNEKVKLPQSYFKKYESLPICPLKKYNYIAYYIAKHKQKSSRIISYIISHVVVQTTGHYRAILVDGF